MPTQWRSAAVCAGFTAIIGLICMVLPPAVNWSDRLSYDLPFLFAPAVPLESVIVVQRDEKSYRDLNQEYGRLWDRSLYVQLLDRLTADHAKLAVLDIFLSDPAPADKNRDLAEAIRRNGRVILAMDYREYPKLQGGEPIFPREEAFKDAAAGLGVLSMLQDKADGVVRQIHPGFGKYPSLAWVAAERAGISTAVFESRLQMARWLSYPPSLERIRRISFAEALEQQPGFFTNKYVFVGGSPRTKLEGDQTDEFATPFRRWGGGLEPGVIIQATAFLNVLHGNWLERTPAVVEMLVVLCLGAFAAGALSMVRPWLGALVAVALLVILFVGACSLMFLAHRWFSWMIVASAEIPFALGWSIIAQARRLAREKELVLSELALERRAVERLLPPTESEAATVRSDVAEAGKEPASASGPTVVSPPQPAVLPAALRGVKWLPPSVPDHTLVRCIGEGSYGQVWLARDVIGTYHAVKFVYRKTFESAAPFDREFKGIHHFTPISRMHAGFVNILHVGRNEKADYFFYIMELADDQNTGQTINPESYTAKTLSQMIRKHGRLAATDCIRLGLELSSALEFLHQHRLIHRDIKPSNVLYVHDQVKFADVGLVTQIDTRRAEATYLGTEGYIAPEGPGTAAADVYSLGKVLYEACMGLDRMRFPDLPTTVLGQADPLLPRLNEIILKACEFNPRERYQSAQELHDDLQTIAPKQTA